MAFTKQKTVTVTADDFVLEGALAHLEVEHGGRRYLFQAVYDWDCPSPREYGDRVWTWTAFERAGYTDKGAIPLEDFRAMRREQRRAYVARPLYLHRHSGDSIGLNNAECPFNDRFDACCMGAAYVRKDTARKGFGWKVLTKKRLQELYRILEGEVEEMNLLLSGRVYGFVWTDLETEKAESCWGFFCSGRHELAGRAADFLTGCTDLPAGLCREIAGELIGLM
jgi:hypothetical protein